MQRTLLALCLMTATCANAQTPPAWKVAKEVSPYVSYILVNKGTDPLKLQGIAETVCGAKAVCIVRFWDDAKQVPSGAEASKSQLRAELATFSFNKKTGHKSMVLGCPLDKSQCD